MSRMCIDSGAGTKNIGRDPVHLDPTSDLAVFAGAGHRDGINCLSGVCAMRCRVIALVSAVFWLCPGSARRREKKDDVRVCSRTDYPAVTLRPGTNSTINLRLQNYNLPPERRAVHIRGPFRVDMTLIGGGQPIAEALFRPPTQRLVRAAGRCSEGGAGRHHQPQTAGARPAWPCRSRCAWPRICW